MKFVLKRRNAFFILAVLSLWAAVVSCATTKEKKEVEKLQVAADLTKIKGPSLEELSKAAKPRLHTTELENGLDLIIIQNHTVPLITIEIAVHTGAYTERPEWDGLMHYYEHMFFKGNKAIPNQTEYMKTIRRLGISFNGFTSTESVRYFFTLPKENLKAGLEFMYHAISEPLFAPEEIEKEKKVVLSEMDRNDSNPYRCFSRALDKALFYKYPERKDTLGKREVIESATPETMRTIQSIFYVPNNAALIIAGDVEIDEAERLAREIYSKWQKGEDPFKKEPVPEHPPLNETKYLTVKKEQVRLARIELYWQGPSIGKDDKSTYAADVLSFLTGLDSSGMQKRLVDSGLAVSAGFGYYSQAHVGPVSVWAVCAPQNVTKVLDALHKELELMKDTTYFDAAELTRAKRSIVISQLYGMERTRSYALNVGFWWSVAGLDYLNGYASNISKVDVSDIQEFLQKYVWDKPHIEGILINPEDADKYLEGTPFHTVKNGG